MRISVVIPAFNEERLIGETLRQVRLSLGAFAERGWATELIVCDNNSTDRTAELARAAEAIVVFEPVNQIARARNCGAAAATGDWLIFVDADSRPSRGLFADVAEEISKGRCLAGGTMVKLDGHYPKANVVTQLWNWVSRTCRWVAGSFIFCEAAAFRAVGGFSTELFASEEIDLSKRLKKLARERKKEIVILRNPILTSGRKMELYSAREHLTFMARTLLKGGRPLRDRNACHVWYDGRR